MSRIYALLSLAIMLAIGGCGLKGPLYLPPESGNNAKQADQGQQDNTVVQTEARNQSSSSTKGATEP